MRYIVRLTEQGKCYGPFDDRGNAEEFAIFLGNEVDPARVLTLHEPASELIMFYNSVVLAERKAAAAGAS